MNIFYWFLIIAAATLLANLVIITVMYHKKSVHALPIAATVIFSFLLAALLYLLTSIHGSELISRKLAATLEIETESFQSAREANDTVYAFCSKEGVEFQFYGAQLLEAAVPAQPTTVEIYYCTVRGGFSWCSLGEDSGIYYVLK